MKSRLTLGIVLFILLISVLATSGCLGSNTKETNEPFEPYGNDNGTFYTSEYLSFFHNPLKTINHGNKLENDSELLQADFENGDGVLIQKPVAATQSAYEEAVESKDLNERFEDSEMTSNADIESIQIAGVEGYKVDSLNYHRGELMSHSINVFFVKNGKLYQITFTSVGKDTINENKENMDKILNSITVAWGVHQNGIKWWN